MTDTRLTRPEKFAELKAGRREVSAMLKNHGACWFCQFRDRESEGWQRAVCKISGRTWPLCSADKLEPAFEADEARLEEFRKANNIRGGDGA